jgi:hypothetical protein
MCAKEVHRGPPRPLGVLAASQSSCKRLAKQVIGFMKTAAELRKRAKGLN